MTNGGPDVNAFCYAEEILDCLEASHSRERLRTYLDAAGGNREEAIRLRVWNTAIRGAIYGPLQVLEIALRNAMSHRLGARYGDAWYDSGRAGLDNGALERVQSARNVVARDGHGDDPYRIVAALSFGFWVALMGPGGRSAGSRKASYEMTLWRPALRRAFAHCDTLARRQARRPLYQLRALRNRIAHHEPIFAQDLVADHQRILDVAG